YVTAPDRSVVGAPFQVVADNAGQAGATFNSGVLRGINGITGIWAITFEGVNTGRKAIAYFEVTP
ncbi:MAG TPA: hypothetical protein PKA05_16135, partial [Roseiflexaceae bacterium]|nr:hypothetical protein [Roseiflexaceae bacterium]